MTAIDHDKLIAEAPNPWARAAATAARVDASFVLIAHSVAEQVFLRGPDVIAETKSTEVVAFAADKLIGDVPEMASFRVYMIAMMQSAYEARMAELQVRTPNRDARRRKAKRS